MSTRWIAVLAGAVALLTLWAVWGAQGRFLGSLVGVSLLGGLVLLGFVVFGRQRPRSMDEVIHDIEGEAVLAPQRSAAPIPRADLPTRQGGLR